MTSDKTSFHKRCVIPIINSLINEKYISSYFFINYNERGPHIRLRLKSDHDSNFVYEVASKKIYSYLESFPSKEDKQRNMNWYPNDSIQLIEYEPEFDRYGGREGVAIAEKQFMNSTSIIFSYFNVDLLNNYQEALNIAIRLHLVSAFVYCNRNIQDAILFFNRIYTGRQLTQTGPFMEFNVKEEINYSYYFTQQKDTLVNYVKNIWTRLRNNEYIDDFLQIWKESETDICKLLENANAQDKLEVLGLYENYPLWSIFPSYIHMTNNRLNISTVDEGLIAYLIMESLKRI